MIKNGNKNEDRRSTTASMRDRDGTSSHAISSVNDEPSLSSSNGLHPTAELQRITLPHGNHGSTANGQTNGGYPSNTIENLTAQTKIPGELVTETQTSDHLVVETVENEGVMHGHGYNARVGYWRMWL